VELPAIERREWWLEPSRGPSITLLLTIGLAFFPSSFRTRIPTSRFSISSTGARASPQPSERASGSGFFPSIFTNHLSACVLIIDFRRPSWWNGKDAFDLQSISENAADNMIAVVDMEGRAALQNSLSFRKAPGILRQMNWARPPSSFEQIHPRIDRDRVKPRRPRMPSGAPRGIGKKTLEVARPARPTKNGPTWHGCWNSTSKRPLGKCHGHP